MRWEDGRRSANVEDRRGSSAGGRVVRGGAVGGGALLLIVVVAVLTGQDPSALLGVLEQAAPPVVQPDPRGGGPGVPSEPDPQKEFVAVVLGDTEDTWGQIFAQGGARYQAPKLVLFRDAVDSACGFTSAAVGPFYCPGDANVYLDLGFFEELDRRLGAGGDFAQAYVIAHEIGHHVQNLLGISGKVDARMARARNAAEKNTLSVRQELQADCFAGVWAFHADKQRQMLERGDVEEGLNAAAAIGDDKLARDAGARVRPESFTHGSSEARVRWFRQGLESGRIDACDTFNADRL